MSHQCFDKCSEFLLAFTIQQECRLQVILQPLVSWSFLEVNFPAVSEMYLYSDPVKALQLD